MKRNRMILLAAFAITIFSGQVTADELQQPVLSPITYTVADDAADSPSDGETWSFFKRDGEGLEINGWTQLGYHDSNAGLFNTNPKKGTVHQVWFEFDKASDADAEGLGMGYHFDLLYGADANNTHASGNTDGWDTDISDDGSGFGWAMPQLYVEGHLGDWTLTAGKFFSPAGYEVVQAPGNFFYSHARTMESSEARTHTGVLASKTTEAGMDLTLGWTAGWDTGFDQNGGNGILGLGKSIGDNISVSYVTSFGDISETENGYTHSVVMQIKLGEKMDYVFQSDYVDTNTRYQIGVNQYVFYAVNDDVDLGARLEWWRNGNNLGADSEYSFTTGVNYRPNSRFNLVLRPEIRIDWNDASANTETIFGIDAVLNY
ncbi:MAG: outer membrane beta-barrel protein [Planctomycetota bacterium]|nr:outer membrane beta-barrel protein [Planctomycetota bacterium]